MNLNNIWEILSHPNIYSTKTVDYNLIDASKNEWNSLIEKLWDTEQSEIVTNDRHVCDICDRQLCKLSPNFYTISHFLGIYRLNCVPAFTAILIHSVIALGTNDFRAFLHKFKKW